MAQVLPQELPRCSHIMFLQTNDSEEFSSSFAMVSNCDASLSDLATPGTMDLLIWAVEKKCLIMLCCGSLLSVFQCRLHIFRTACGCVVCEPRVILGEGRDIGAGALRGEGLRFGSFQDISRT